MSDKPAAEVKKSKVQWMEELKYHSVEQLQERHDLLRASGVRGWAVTAEAMALKQLMKFRENAPEIEPEIAGEEPIGRGEFYANVIYAIAQRMGTSEFTVHNINEVLSALGGARWAYLCAMGYVPEAEMERERMDEMREAFSRDSRFKHRGGYNEHISEQPRGPKAHAANTGAPKDAIEAAFAGNGID